MRPELFAPTRVSVYVPAAAGSESSRDGVPPAGARKATAARAPPPGSGEEASGQGNSFHPRILWRAFPVSPSGSAELPDRGPGGRDRWVGVRDWRAGARDRRAGALGQRVGARDRRARARIRPGRRRRPALTRCRSGPAPPRRSRGPAPPALPSPGAGRRPARPGRPGAGARPGGAVDDAGVRVEGGRGGGGDAGAPAGGDGGEPVVGVGDGQRGRRADGGGPQGEGGRAGDGVEDDRLARQVAEREPRPAGERVVGGQRGHPGLRGELLGHQAGRVHRAPEQGGVDLAAGEPGGAVVDAEEFERGVGVLPLPAPEQGSGVRAERRPGVPEAQGRRRSPAGSTAASKVARAAAARSRKARPSAVRARWWVERSTSRMPRCRSRAASVRETAGWVRWSRAAALVRLDSSAMARKQRRWRSSMLMRREHKRSAIGISAAARGPVR